MTEKIIWVLADDRAGNVGQVMGVAQQLISPYIKKDIKYNRFAKIPNILRGASLLGIDLANSSELKQELPDLVIAAGRRLAPVSLYIKKRKPSCKIVHIMHPDCSYKNFDMVVLPEHDKVRSGDNVVTSIGALHKITHSALSKEAAIWQDKFAHLPKPYIVVLVGGNSKNGVFTSQHASELGKMANNLASSFGGSLLITTSRRTDDYARSTMMKELSVPSYCYYYGIDGGNPYMGFLALADFIIVTGDSISMCSESCYTGKPVYIYSPQEITGNKHRAFQSQLFNHGFAMEFKGKLGNIAPHETLDETKRIASLIRKKFL